MRAARAHTFKGYRNMIAYILKAATSASELFLSKQVNGWR